MRVECPNCSKSYKIPDERIPIGKKITFPCPACKYRICLDLRSKSKPGDDISCQSHPSKKMKHEATDRSLPSTEKKIHGNNLKKKILKALTDLPPMPQVLSKAREIMARSHSSFKEIGNVLETDQAIAARVLKLANSAYYGLSGMVSSIQHAAVVLGHEKLGEIITLAGTSSFLGKKLKGYGLESGDLWRHSLAVAYGSKIIASRRNPKLANDAFSAGLFHDAGKIILDPYIFENKEAFNEQIKNHQKTFQSAEKKILGFDHSDIASEFCMKWNIPESLSIAIKYHHEPSLSQENELAYILNMANSIAIMTGIGTNTDNALLNQVDEKTIEFLNLADEDVDKIKIEVEELIEKIVNEIHTT